MTGNSEHRIVAADAGGIALAAEALLRGDVVALPTETVYGLAARADSDEAVAAIYRTKGRPDFNPLIVHVAGLEAARGLARVDSRAERLAEAFWPGALTLVLPRREDAALAGAVTAGLPTVAIRCPAHGVMRAVLAATGLALAAPSANRSGAISPTCAAHVFQSLVSKAGLVLDGGACAAGIESTIVALREHGGWQVLRPGPVTQAQIAAVIGVPADVMASGSIEAPGQLASHYAPGKPLRLNAATAMGGEFHLGFGAVEGDFNLSAAGDLAEAASRLYAGLHAGAASAHQRIAVAPIPKGGIGTAINDRLKRAAA